MTNSVRALFENEKKIPETVYWNGDHYSGRTNSLDDHRKAGLLNEQLHWFSKGIEVGSGRNK